MYSIYAGGTCIYDDVSTLVGLKVVKPKLTLEDNSAGSLTITLPPSNVGYSTIARLTTDISVRKHGEEIWAGRVLSESEDFYRNRTLTCEGELAFFNDSIQPPAKYSGLSVRDYLAKLIEVHNSKVAANRQFAIGGVTVEDSKFPDRYTNNESTMSLINALIEEYGGHIRVRKSDGVRYLDYLKDYPNTCSQTIQFGTNLLDFTKKWDFTEFATAIVPLGNQLEKSSIEGLDTRLTVESENNGSIYLQSDEAVNAYGWIAKAVVWNDISDAGELKKKAETYLADLQFDKMELELSALDLHYLDVNVDAVDLLDEIRVISRPHGLDKLFPVTKLEIPLDTPEQTQFSLGDTVKTSLTSANKQTSAEFQQKLEQLPGPILKKAKDNALQIMNQATTGFITITKNEHGSDALYISNTQDHTVATKLWRWDMTGLYYLTRKEEDDPDNPGSKKYVVKDLLSAITMDGSIVADRVNTGVLNADIIQTGVLRDYPVDENGNDLPANTSFDLKTGVLTIKKGFIGLGDYKTDVIDKKEVSHYNFEVDNDGNLFARNGIFAGRLLSASGTFGGDISAATGTFKGTVQADAFLDAQGNNMMSNAKFTSKYLDLYELTIYKRKKQDDGKMADTNEVTFKVDELGQITINGNITMGAGSTIDWNNVGNQNLDNMPGYALVNDALDAVNNLDIPVLPSYIQSTKITSTTIESPTIIGGEFYGNEFNVIADGTNGSFNLYGRYNNRRLHLFKISYYASDHPYITIESPAEGTINFAGQIDFAAAKVVGL